MRIAIAATVVCLSIAGLSTAQDASATIRRSTNIPAQELALALQAFAQDRNLQVLYFSQVVKDLRTGGASGDLTAEETLLKLLSGTGLTYRYVDERAITILPIESAGASPKSTVAEPEKDTAAGKGSFWDRFRLAQVTEGSSPSQGEGEDEDGGENTKQSEGNSDQEASMEEVVVTGTHIRGVAPGSSPLMIYDREYLEKAGVATTEEFTRQLPQNFSSTDSIVWGHSFVASNPGLQQTGSAYAGQSGINLHGLGASSTLVLLNGHRLAPSGSSSDFVDISTIPLSAIERVEVLTDGASALYGADAVAGVVNFVLRKNFSGSETTVRRAGAQGGGEQFSASQLFGASWNKGNVLTILDYNNQSRLLSKEREFIPRALVSTTLLPETSSSSLFIAGQQEIPWELIASADGFYVERDVYAVSGRGNPTSPNFIVGRGDITNYGGTLGLSRELPKEWRVSVTTAFSKAQQEQRGERWVLGELTPQSEVPPAVSNTSLLEADIRADGSLFALGAETVKLALGLGHRSERSSTPFAQFRVGETLKRRVGSAYAELFLPVTSALSNWPLVKRLELSLAARFDSYDGELGSSVDPKFGVLWAPIADLHFRGTYATSYRVPLLDQIVFLPAYSVRDLPDPSAPDGTTLTLINGSNGAEIRPEESDTFTLGVDIRPAALPSLLVTATYFETSFNGRISAPPLIGSVANLYNQQAALGPLIHRSPNLDEVETVFANGWVDNPEEAPNGASSVEAIFDFRLLNIAMSKQSGIDASASYAFSTSYGDLTASLTGTYLLELQHQAISTAIPIDFLNNVGQPVDLRIRGGINWSKSQFSSSLNLNYSAGYTNRLATPATAVASWTTADLYFGYNWEQRGILRLLHGAKLSLAVQNVTDQDPPFVRSPFTFVGLDGGYDPANASPVGRVIALQISKPW